MHDIVNPPGWKAGKGYANGIVAEGRFVFLGGQIGWNANQEFESDDFVDQVRQTLQNIAAILNEAGGAPEHLVRLTWYVTDRKEYLSRLKEVGHVYRDVLGAHYPAMALMEVGGLVEDRARVEIEATAVLPSP